MTGPAETPAPPRRIEPRLHAPVDGTPYFDEELQLPQSRAHMAMVIELGSVLRALSEELGRPFLSDNPIWYLDVADDAQRVSFPDLALLAPGTDVARVTAEEAPWVAEVVSTDDRRREIKDTRFQVAMNEYNEVPELALLFPELEDPRALRFHRLVEGHYQELEVGPGGSVASESVPGLELRVLPRSEWRPGRKVQIYYRGEHRLPLDEAVARAEEERARAEQERARAEEERARADAAEQEAAQARAESEAARARAEKAEAELARLQRELGMGD